MFRVSTVPGVHHHSGCNQAGFTPKHYHKTPGSVNSGHWHEVSGTMTSRFPTEQERAKRDVLSKLLELGLVAIQLDSRVEGVDVPPQHLGQPALVLNLSRKFNQRVLDLGPLAIKATLSFGGNPYTVRFHTLPSTQW